MYVDLISKMKETNTTFNTIHAAVTGGAPCSPQLFRNIKEILGAQKVKVSYPDWMREPT